DSELLLSARPARRRRRPRHPRIDGDRGAPARAAPLGVRLPLPPALRGFGERPVLVPGVLDGLRPPVLLRADAADARGGGHPGPARGPPPHGVLRAPRTTGD